MGFCARFDTEQISMDELGSLRRWGEITKVENERHFFFEIRIHHPIDVNYHSPLIT
jgi:hypothetical protein